MNNIDGQSVSNDRSNSISNDVNDNFDGGINSSTNKHTVAENKSNESDEVKVLNQEKPNRLEQRKRSIIEFVLRQTEYTQEQAVEKLEKVNYDGKIVVDEYLKEDIPVSSYSKSNDKEVSINQQIYGEIRNLMDTGMRQYNERQEQAKKQHELQEYLKTVREYNMRHNRIIINKEKINTIIEEDANEEDANEVDTNEVDTNEVDTNEVDTNEVDTKPSETQEITNDCACCKDAVSEATAAGLKD
tara:strand:+ start:344 stop:1075 length:732 start_codon:yes stop_codon:yes gene_type:complete